MNQLNRIRLVKELTVGLFNSNLKRMSFNQTILTESYTYDYLLKGIHHACFRCNLGGYPTGRSCLGCREASSTSFVAIMSHVINTA